MRSLISRTVTVIGTCALAMFSVAMFGAAAPSADAATVQGIDGNVIRIGGVYDGTSFYGEPAGFAARIDRANRDHELGKYTIDVVASDNDSENPQTDLSDVQNLIERQNVFALAPVETEGFTQPSATLAADHQISYFGPGFDNSFCEPNTWGISNLGCAVGGKYTNGMAVAQVAKGLGKPVKDLRWAFVGLDLPSGTQADDAYANLVTQAGGKVVYNQAAIPTNVGNLSPIVNSIEATKPDVIWVLAADQTIAMKSALKASGFTGPIVDNALYAPGVLSIAAVANAVNGTYIEATTPVLESKTPYVEQMIADYKASGQPVSAITFGGEYAFMTADLLIAALKKAEPNFSKLHSIMESGFTFTPKLGGFPVKYPFMYNASIDCGTFVKAENSEYVVVAPFECSNHYNIRKGA